MRSYMALKYRIAISIKQKQRPLYYIISSLTNLIAYQISTFQNYAIQMGPKWFPL